jgi:hypothetical protein
MANYTENTEITAKRFVTVSSRYASSDVIYYTENKLLTFKTYKKNTIPLSREDKYTVISPGYEYRPDLMSYNAYGVVDFWYRIMEANNLKDIWEFKAGLNIRIPPAGLA